MDFIITFFRDILDGYLYIIVTVINSILICSCIGYMAEVSINKKKQEQQYNETHSTVNNTVQVASNVQTNINSMPSNVVVQQTVPQVPVQNMQQSPTQTIQQVPPQGVVNPSMSVPQTITTGVAAPNVINTVQDINNANNINFTNK